MYIYLMIIQSISLFERIYSVLKTISLKMLKVKVKKETLNHLLKYTKFYSSIKVWKRYMKN